MSNMIKHIDYFPAGYCSSHSGLLFKGIPNEKMQFPAGVFLIHHREKGYILYDTGYHYEIKKKARYFWYRLATPMQMKKEDQINYLLQERGIDPASISYVILSHLHPDHLGGAALFPNAHFFVTQEVYEVYQKPKFKDLIFKEFLPADFKDRVTCLKADQRLPAFPYRPTADLFGDGSILVSSIDGNARGQGCLYMDELKLFIGADLSWGVDLLPYTRQMRLIPSLVQDDKKAYLKGTDLLETLLQDGIQVVVSHDPQDRIERILNEKNSLSENLY